MELTRLRRFVRQTWSDEDSPDARERLPDTESNICCTSTNRQVYALFDLLRFENHTEISACNYEDDRGRTFLRGTILVT